MSAKMSANNTDILVSNETTNTTSSSNNELNKTSTDSKTNSTNSGNNSQAEKRPHDNSGSYFNCFFHNKWVEIFSEKAFLILCTCVFTRYSSNSLNTIIIRIFS